MKHCYILQIWSCLIYHHCISFSSQFWKVPWNCHQLPIRCTVKLRSRVECYWESGWDLRANLTSGSIWSFKSKKKVKMKKLHNLLSETKIEKKFLKAETVRFNRFSITLYPWFDFDCVSELKEGFLFTSFYFSRNSSKKCSVKCIMIVTIVWITATKQKSFFFDVFRVIVRFARIPKS